MSSARPGPPEAAEVAGEKSRIPGVTHDLRRLLPDPGETTVAAQLGGLDLKPRALPHRPYLVLNFATTLDGRAAIAGRSGPIGSDADTEMLERLRTRVDAVMIGAGTMRAERYGRMVSDPHFRAYRERTGLAHDPLAVIVSNRLELPWDATLFTNGGGRVVIFTASEQSPPETPTPVTVVRHPDGVELDRALEWLLKERGIRSVLCEGGPTLHGRLREGGLADELFLTFAPKIAGGEAPRVLEGALPDVDRVELAWLLEREGELYARYRGIS
jgi:riboflavin-specific deaminase-like protein